MARSETSGKELQPYRIGARQVTSPAECIFLEELFVWLLDQAHWPRTQKEWGNGNRGGHKKQQLQQLRAYKAMLGRVRSLSRQFPHDRAWLDVSEVISRRITELGELTRLVTYAAKDGFNWYMPKGVMPAIGPRLLLALCIAKELHPARSPYLVVIEQMGQAQDPNPDIVNNYIRAIQKRGLDVIRQPKKYPVFGGERTSDPVVLLRHELFDFKCWKEQQRQRPDQTIEEFDAQFGEYMNRIRPTAAEEKLLRTLLKNFVQGTHRSTRAKPEPGATSKTCE
jgi:hypothetical protein